MNYGKYHSNLSFFSLTIQFYKMFNNTSRDDIYGWSISFFRYTLFNYFHAFLHTFTLHQTKYKCEGKFFNIWTSLSNIDKQENIVSRSIENSLHSKDHARRRHYLIMHHLVNWMNAFFSFIFLMRCKHRLHSLIRKYNH